MASHSARCMVSTLHDRSPPEKACSCSGCPELRQTDAGECYTYKCNVDIIFSPFKPAVYWPYQLSAVGPAVRPYVPALLFIPRRWSSCWRGCIQGRCFSIWHPPTGQLTRLCYAADAFWLLVELRSRETAMLPFCNDSVRPAPNLPA